MKKIIILILLTLVPLNVYSVEVLEEKDIITREVKGAYLKELEVINYEISPSFDKMNNDYTLNVPSHIDKINIVATPFYDNARVQIVGNNNLNYGENIVIVKVSLESDIQEYKLIVNREKEKNVINYIEEEDENTITYLYKDKNLIILIASITLLIILITGLIIFKKKKKRI